MSLSELNLVDQYVVTAFGNLLCDVSKYVSACPLHQKSYMMIALYRFIASALF
jgi:hypothetical protein